MSNNMANRANDLAVMLGVSYGQALQMIKDFKLAVDSFDSGKSSIEFLADSISDIIQEKEVDYVEPLWVVRQQDKHFKRGRN